MNLLEMAKEFKPEKFIFGSSSSVYGENKRFPFSEDDSVDLPGRKIGVGQSALRGLQG